MHDYHYWLIFSLILGIIELTIGANFFLMWCGLSALFVSGLTYLFAWPLEGQWIIFSIIVIVVLFIWQKFKPKFMSKQPSIMLNQKAHQYLHRELYLEEAIVNGFGKVKIDDSSWRVEGVDLPQGTKVKVIGIDGTILKVARIT